MSMKAYLALLVGIFLVTAAPGVGYYAWTKYSICQDYKAENARTDRAFANALNMTMEDYVAEFGAMPTPAMCQIGPVTL